MREFLKLRLSRGVARRAGVTALVVGTILILINHGDALLDEPVDTGRLSKIILTALVPYLVSTVSSASLS